MSYSDDNTYEKILDRCLNNELLVNVDKRVGSIAYDALAPFSLALADAYQALDVMEAQTYLMSATGTNLDRRVYDYGIARVAATYSERIGSFKKYQIDNNGDYVLDENNEKVLIEMEIPEGSRFTLPDDNTTTYIYTGKKDGYNILRCEQAGSKGDLHEGTILPLVPIQNLIEAKITGTYTPAQDREIDEVLRERTKKHLNYMTYGGNIADYIERVNALDGVGQTKVFPAWQYNGSVLLSVVSPTFDPITQEFCQNLKNQIDPEGHSGDGVGFAPIGHYVTVTTPVKSFVDIKMDIQTEFDSDAGEVYEAIVETIENYFQEERERFAQDVRLAIYRYRILAAIKESVPKVVNVVNLFLNDEDDDVIYTDEGVLGHQYLPYVRDIIVNNNQAQSENDNNSEENTEGGE